MKEREWMRLLKQSHEVARWLAERLEEADLLAARKYYKDQLTNVLGGHLLAIEGCVLPAIQRHGWKGVHAGMLVAHFELKAATAQLVVADPATDDFGAAVDRLKNHLDRERGIEHGELLPAIESTLPPEERRQLGIDVDLQLSRSVGELAAAAELRELPPSDPIEEARVVLSSLPGAGLVDEPPDTAGQASA